jgi:hypothetical protein
MAMLLIFPLLPILLLIAQAYKHLYHRINNNWAVFPLFSKPNIITDLYMAMLLIFPLLPILLLIAQAHRHLYHGINNSWSVFPLFSKPNIITQAVQYMAMLLIFPHLPILLLIAKAHRHLYHRIKNNWAAFLFSKPNVVKEAPSLQCPSTQTTLLRLNSFSYATFK